MCGQGLFINLWPTLKPFNLMPALCKWETFMIFADASDFSPPLLRTDIHITWCSSSVLFEVWTMMVQQPAWHLAIPTWNSSLPHRFLLQLCGTCRPLDVEGDVGPCWSVPHGHMPHIPSDTWHPRRTVEAASGQYVVLDCTSGCTENSTAYLAPWMKFRYSFWILSNHHFFSKVQTHTCFKRQKQ